MLLTHHSLSNGLIALSIESGEAQGITFIQLDSVRRGNCWLKQAAIAQLVELNLLNHSHCCGPQGRTPDAFRYELRAWCIMPNHVHVLFKTENAPMSDIVGGWKTNTGRLANRLLKRRGAFWAEDYFDTFMRDVEHERRTVRYIENNPTKAKFVLDPKGWLWSSARFREPMGDLELPV